MRLSMKAAVRGPRFLGYLVIALVALLAGCAGGSPMRVALTELGTVSDSEYGAYGLRLVRAVNVTGLGPEEVVGTLTTDPDKWSIREQLARFFPERSDLPDSMTPRLVPGASEIVERRFCKAVTDTRDGDGNLVPAHCAKGGDVTLAGLVELRDKLQESQAKVAEAVRLELKSAALDAALTALKTGPAEGTSGILAALQALYPNDGLSDAKKVEDARDATVAARNPAGLIPLLAETKKLSSTSGVIVTRWEREVEASGSLTAGDAAKVSAAGKRKLSGFLILGEPRITSLRLGSDFAARAKEKSLPGSAESLFKSHRNYLTYYQLRARYVLFSESREEALQAALQADVAKIAQTLGAARINTDTLTSISARAEALYAAIAASSGSGVLDAEAGYVQTHACSLLRNAGTGTGTCLGAEMQRSAGTLPVISIRAAFDDFVASNSPGAHALLAQQNEAP
ncbi:hypothetical protein AAFF27_19955 [Xylophilus sp. GW821-FHT01B05]